MGAGHQRLDKARGEDASLTARRVRLGALADAAEAVEQAASVRAGAEAVALRSRGEVADRVQRHGLRSSEAAVAALLDEKSRSGSDRDDPRARGQPDRCVRRADLGY
ncbi:MAG: hypothetical protein WKF47_14875 [Geodermatophilaceae bacterium]